MRPIIFILTLLGLFTLALANANGLSSTTDTYEFDVILDGHQVSLNGTLQEIIAQMKTLYPDSNPEAHYTELQRHFSNVMERAVQGFICWPVPGWDWAPTVLWPIQASSQAIRLGIPEQFINPDCHRIWCEGGGAVWICNDYAYEQVLDSGLISAYIDSLILNCSGLDGNSVCGQWFDTRQWNVIVRRDTC